MSLYPNTHFEVLHRDPQSRARTGILTTPHGPIETPTVASCATFGEVKTITMDQVRDAGTQMILSNTYHLLAKGWVEDVERAGGLHRWNMQGDPKYKSVMGGSGTWRGPWLTDSGGYQIFAMGHGSVSEDVSEIKRKRERKSSRDEISRSGLRNASTLKDIVEDGALFTSYEDGSEIFLTPERSIDIQRRLGADLIVQLDELTSLEHDEDYTARSMALSMRWGDRSLAEFKRHADGSQAIYGVVQGGIYPHLRQRSADYVASAGFFGTAVGGCLGDSQDQMYDIIATTMPHVHPHHPVHLLGIGMNFKDIFANVRQGIDTFDCVHHTRVARHGTALLKGAHRSRIDLTKGRYKEDHTPIDETCGCYACAKGLERSYIRKMYKAHYILSQEEKNKLPLDENAARLLTIHNSFTMARMMSDIRRAIVDGTLDVLEKEWVVEHTEGEGV